MSAPTSPAPAASALSQIGRDHPAYPHILAGQKAPRVSELTLGLLHRFNNLFTGVMFLTEDCAAKAEAGEPLGAQLSEMLDRLKQAHACVNRITRLHADEEEDDAGYYELDVVLADQLDLVRLLLPRGTTVTHTLAEERLTFYASQRAVCEILLEVVGNSADALPRRGGALSITSRLVPGNDATVAVEIRDNGPGFAAEILDGLFVSCGTTKDQSRHPGFGLRHCRELARTFGGDLIAGNHPEGGAVVTLTLPRDNSAAAS